jgi:hypothetical protein
MVVFIHPMFRLNAHPVVARSQVINALFVLMQIL